MSAKQPTGKLEENICDSLERRSLNILRHTKQNIVPGPRILPELLTIPRILISSVFYLPQIMNMKFAIRFILACVRGISYKHLVQIMSLILNYQAAAAQSV